MHLSRPLKTFHKHNPVFLKFVIKRLEAVKERAAERYSKSGENSANGCSQDNDERRKHSTEAGISKEEKKRRDLASVMRKRQKMIEIGPYLQEVA